MTAQRTKAPRRGLLVVPFLLPAALLVDGRAVIDPLLQSAATMREAKRNGGSHRFHPTALFCRRLTHGTYRGRG